MKEMDFIGERQKFVILYKNCKHVPPNRPVAYCGDNSMGSILQ